MSASVMGFSPVVSRNRSPEDVCSLFPDRPIRPLPKRKLRERLSPEVASAIDYPPAPPIAAPLFYYPHNLYVDEERSRGLQDERARYTQHLTSTTKPKAHHGQRRQIAEESERRNYVPKNKGDELDSEDEWKENDSQIESNRGRHARGSPQPRGKAYRYVQKSESAKYPSSEPPVSATSSIDGYDSFENTNNKKKRKIPTPGDVGLNGIHLGNELASLGITQDSQDALNDVEYYGSGPAGSPVSGGLSGAGRGRRVPKHRQQWPSTEPSGIISNAIAKAEKSPVTPTRGQESVSLLEEASRATPASSGQFTFTCNSQVPSPVSWPGQVDQDMNQREASRKTQREMTTRATQTSPNALPNIPHREAPRHPEANSKQLPKKKNHRRTGREYLIAAQQRREQQEYKNYHHPPSPEDEWVCEFCEYERIFGEPPRALIQQYELKDRKLKQQEAERRRLLEKAKMKGRKGKKGAKSKSAATSRDHLAHPVDSDGICGDSQCHGIHSEDCYEEEYDEGTQVMQPATLAIDHPAVRMSEGEAFRPSGVQGGVGSSEIPGS